MAESSADAAPLHPLYASDRDLVDQLLAARDPSDGQLLDLGRLFMRYAGFPGARDLQDDLDKDRKSTRLNSSHVSESRMPSSA